MSAYQRPPSSNTILAVVTAFATLVGAIGGLIATVYAVGITDSGNAASTPTPPPAATSTNAPPPTPAPTPTPSLSAPRSFTPAVIVITADADRWWGPPGTSSGDHEDDGGETGPGQTEELSLSWGCSDDSRGNGSRKDCGSGVIAVHFDLTDLPDDVSIEEAVLSLHAVDGAGNTLVNAMPATSEWSENDSYEPSCDSSDETSAGAADDEWIWDATALVRDQYTGDAQNVGFCLLLNDNAGTVTFTSREGAVSSAPSLTVTYTHLP